MAGPCREARPSGRLGAKVPHATIAVGESVIVAERMEVRPSRNAPSASMPPHDA